MASPEATLAIGSTVRVTLTIAPVRAPPTAVPGRRARRRAPDGGPWTVACRALVATGADAAGRVALVRDDFAPIPLGPSGGTFLVAPAFVDGGAGVVECEAAAADAAPLLAFELERDDCGAAGASDARDAMATVQNYKECGDQLMRVNDFTCAIAYYEAALGCVSSEDNLCEVGGALVVRQGGHCVVAEVDCVEKDEQGNVQWDVTYVSGEEATLARSDILLAVPANDAAWLQPRILLNLSRSLLKLAEVDTAQGTARCVGDAASSAKHSRPERYRRAAVLGCSIALAVLQCHATGADAAAPVPSLIEKARIVRARAFLALRKVPNATMDAKKALALNAANREARSLLDEIEAVKRHSKALDKRLSKEVCRWVQTAANSAEGTGALEGTADAERRHT